MRKNARVQPAGERNVTHACIAISLSSFTVGEVDVLRQPERVEAKVPDHAPVQRGRALEEGESLALGIKCRSAVPRRSSRLGAQGGHLGHRREREGPTGAPCSKHRERLHLVSGLSSVARENCRQRGNTHNNRSTDV